MPPSSKPPVVPPEAFARALRAQPEALALWDRLAPSHKREYVTWIETAKRDETRSRRVAQAVALLLAKEKTPMRANDAPKVSAAPLAKKVGIEEGVRAVVVADPSDYAAQIGAAAKGKGAVVLLFARDLAGLARDLPRALAALDGEQAALWVAYPKKSSKVASDLSRDCGWAPLAERGWQGVSLVSVDDAWSAMRFRKIE
jgi:hypothetical protein